MKEGNYQHGRESRGEIVQPAAGEGGSFQGEA